MLDLTDKNRTVKSSMYLGVSIRLNWVNFRIRFNLVKFRFRLGLFCTNTSLIEFYFNVFVVFSSFLVNLALR